jgi:GNAT superfamily N-acetyltransferase
MGFPGLVLFVYGRVPVRVIDFGRGRCPLPDPAPGDRHRPEASRGPEALSPPRRFHAATNVRLETVFGHVLEAEFALLSSVSEVVRRPWGAILVAPDYPAIHEANMAWVDAVPPGGISQVLLELDGAMRAQGISFRRLEFSDAKAAHRLQAGLVDLGYRADRTLAMVRLRPAPCIRNEDLEVREVDTPEEWAVFDALMEEMNGESGHAPEVSQAHIERHHERADALGERVYLGLLGGEGVGLATLIPRERLGLVAELGTRKRFRRQGIARTLLDEVSDRANALRLPYVGLISRWENDPARALYESLGFEPVGEIRGFHKD